MQALINALAQQFGMRPEQVQTAVGAVLGLVRERAGQKEFAALVASVPGAQAWIDQAGQAKAPADGGGLLGQAAGLLGALGAGSAPGGIGALLGQLQQSGLKPETALQFLPALMEQFRSTAGAETVKKVIEEIPALKGGAGPGGALGSLLGR